VSRHHAQLAVDDSGAVWLSSLGREPVSINGMPATEPIELFAGDQIEVHCSSQGLQWRRLITASVLCLLSSTEDFMHV
jgi:hypothetical protein